MQRNDEFTQLLKRIEDHSVKEVEYKSDGTCPVTLIIPLEGQTGLLSILSKKIITNPQKDVAPSQSTSSALQHTGIIIDTQGYKIKSKFYQSIYDEERNLIFGPANMDPDRTIGYEVSLAAAKKNPSVGKNPLIIKVTGTVKTEKGEVTCVIIDDESVQKFTQAISGSDIILRGAIVFVID